MSDLPFEPIKLKASAGGPPYLRSIQAARNFVTVHVDSEKCKELHWIAAISALDTVINGNGSFAHARLAMHNALATEGWLAE